MTLGDFIIVPLSGIVPWIVLGEVFINLTMPLQNLTAVFYREVI